MEVVIKGPDEYASIIAQQIQLCANRSSGGPVNIELIQQNGQLELLEQVTFSAAKRSGKSSQPSISRELRHNIDVAQFVKQQKSWPAAKQKPLSQAVGRKTRKLIDATAGWGGDAMRFCAQGYEVICLERQPLFALLLSDAMRVIAETEWAQKNAVSVPAVKCGEAIQLLGMGELDADCIYLDPMFPSKRKSSAMANKSMELLHRLIGEDIDADSLLRHSAENYPRTVVKRPNYAPPLWREPDEQFGGKLIRYDVYFQSRSKD
jgi:16S rRNA (guanine1516-N2)-methyltransferase